jgi:hypothetical protein
MREPIHLNLPEGIDFPEAERAARKAAQSVGTDIALVSFYDRALNKMAPQSSALCAGDKGYKVYAESRGADIRVIINDGQYDFYFMDFQAG